MERVTRVTGLFLLASAIEISVYPLSSCPVNRLEQSPLMDVAGQLPEHDSPQSVVEGIPSLERDGLHIIEGGKEPMFRAVSVRSLGD